MIVHRKFENNFIELWTKEKKKIVNKKILDIYENVNFLRIVQKVKKESRNTLNSEQFDLDLISENSLKKWKMPKIFLIKNRLHQQQLRLLESQNSFHAKNEDRLNIGDSSQQDHHDDREPLSLVARNRNTEDNSVSSHHIANDRHKRNDSGELSRNSTRTTNNNSISLKIFWGCVMFMHIIQELLALHRTSSLFLRKIWICARFLIWPGCVKMVNVCICIQQNSKLAQKPSDEESSGDRFVIQSPYSKITMWESQVSTWKIHLNIYAVGMNCGFRFSHDRYLSDVPEGWFLISILSAPFQLNICLFLRSPPLWFGSSWMWKGKTKE